MGLSTPPVGTLLGDATYPHRLYHTGLTEVRYAHPSGDNDEDGLTWGTAKADVLSAYDDLPSGGGTIYIANDTYWDSVNTDRGLWLLGSNDPGYNGGAPTGGWRVRKPCRFVGVGGMYHANSHHGPAANVRGSSASDRSKPSIWIAGLGGPLYFENIHNQYPAVGWRIGIESDQSGMTDSSGITFVNCSATVANGVEPGKGPTVELGYTYWLYFEDCTFSGNGSPYTLTAATRSGTTATFTTSITHYLEVGDTVYVIGVTPSGYNGTWTVTSVTSTTFVCTLTADPGGSGTVFGTAEPVKNYRRAAIATEPDRIDSAGFGAAIMTFDNCIFNGGGFYNKPNGVGGWGAISMRNITHEGDFTGPEPPTFFCRTRTYGDSAMAGGGIVSVLENIMLADASTGAAVEVEGPTTDPLLVSVIGAGVQGNVTQLGRMDGRQQVGIDNGEFIGRRANRSFSPAAVRYANQASQTLSGGSWTTGIRAPDGTTNASSLTAGNDGLLTVALGLAFGVGDWVVAGVWRRQAAGPTSSSWEDYPLVNVNSGTLKFDTPATASGNYFILLRPHLWEDGGWAWYAEAHYVAVAGTGDAYLTLRSNTGSTVEYFAPVWFRIPAADGLADEEVYELVRHLQPYPTTAPVGSLSALSGQKLLVPAGIGVGNSASATTSVGALARKIEVFDASGASLGFVPVYSTIT